MGNDTSSQVSHPLPGSSPLPGAYIKFDEPAEGDCLFEALSRQLPKGLGNRSGPTGVRAEACDWLQFNLLPLTRDESASGTSLGTWQIDAESALSYDHRQLFFESYPEYSSSRVRTADYIEQMRFSGVWGSGLEALAVAYLSLRPVWIWREHVESAPEVLQSPLSSPDAQPIGLLNIGAKHWQSIVITLDSSAQPCNRGSSRVQETARETAQFQEEPSWHAGYSLNEAERELRRQRNLSRHKSQAECTREQIRPRPKTKSNHAGQEQRFQRQMEHSHTSRPEVKPSYVDVTSMQMACLALQRVGLSEEEAASAVEENQDNLNHLKELYCIDWDDQRTLQRIFEGTS